jgi:hypothetical protein
MAKDISNLNQTLDGNFTTAMADAEETNLDLFLLNLQHKEKAQLASDKRINKAQQVLEEGKYKAQIEHAKALGGTEEEIAKRVADIKKKMAADVVELAQKMEESIYRYSDKQTKIQIKNEQRATLEKGKLALKQKLAEKMADDSHIISKAHAAKKLNAQIISAQREELKVEEDKRNLTLAALKDKRRDGVITGQELAKQFSQVSETFEAERQGHEQNIDFINEQIEAQKKFIEENEGKQGAGLAIKQAKENISNLESQKSEEKSAMKASDKNRFGTELLANTMKSGFKAMENSLSVLGDKFIKGVDNAIDTVGQFRSGIEARLQGSQSSYDSVAKTLKSTLSVSPFVKQTEVLNNLNDAVNKGIAYNVEQRAFLSTLSDKIVATFDAFDSNLMRIIRLQQADTTGARMGMEANLLQFFNSTFSDSSYLSDGYDRVSEALVDANAQMTRDMSIAFEYNVQKWMGSLASLGFGTDTITKIATGINYLGSGNVAALAGDSQLQSLLAMSASRAGLSYSELLVKGIDDSSVNTLLKSMVEYLAEIADDDNAVVKAAYGDVFNFTQADLRAIKNIANDEGATIENIYNSSMTYAKSMSELQSQLNQIGSRLSTTEMINNVFDNFLYTAGETLANNPVTALMWKTLTVMEEVTGGIEIPFVNVYGFGLDLNMSVESLLKTGMFGLSALSNVGNMVSSIASGGGLDLDSWGFKEYTSRGGEFQSTVGGVQSTKSGSKTLTSASSSDSKKQALSSTEEDQEEQKKSSKESMKDEITLETLYKEIFEKKTPIYVIDSPLNSKTETIVTAVSNVNNKVSQLYDLLSSSSSMGIRAYVTNIDKTPTTTVPSSFTISKINDKNFTQELAKQIAQGVLGSSDDTTVDGVATLSDIANILLTGVISVRDDVTSRTLQEINSNLY